MNKKPNFFVQVFDIFFIMALCFATLLSSMLLNGAVIVGSEARGIVYTFPLHSILIVVTLTVVFFVFLLRNSDVELRAMIKEVYDDPNKTSVPNETPVLPVSDTISAK